MYNGADLSKMRIDNSVVSNFVYLVTKAAQNLGHIGNGSSKFKNSPLYTSL